MKIVRKSIAFGILYLQLLISSYIAMLLGWLFTVCASFGETVNLAIALGRENCLPGKRDCNQDRMDLVGSGTLSHVYLENPPLWCSIPETRGLFHDDGNKLLLSPTADQVLPISMQCKVLDFSHSFDFILVSSQSLFRLSIGVVCYFRCCHGKLVHLSSMILLILIQ